MTPAPTQTQPSPRSSADRRRLERRRAQRRQTIRRRRAAAALALIAMVGLVVAASFGLGPTHPRTPPSPPARSTAPLARAPFAVREQTVTYVDSTRFVALRDGTRARRRIVTRLLYPAAPAGRRLPGPFPLIVFGHGFALAPGDYWPLLTAWARAGYVVAAPVFPLENRGAPGGPNEADLSNQPGDMAFVITRVLAAAAPASSPLHALVNPGEVAVAGHSDGGDSALAVAEGSNRDHRVGAAIVLAGAEMPGLTLDAGGPPLLAMQGSSDTVNPPADTSSFFDALTATKFLVSLPGAGHIAPFSRQQPQATVVAAVTQAFLDRYVKGETAASARLAADANRAGVAQLSSGS